MLKTAPVFKNHAVLQREKPIRIWGACSEENQIITVSINDISVQTKVRNQKWCVTLPPMHAGGPYDLKISSPDAAFILSDIMIGEVWLCGGQSNMEMALINSRNPEPALENCKNSNVRLYHVCKRGHFDDEFFREENASVWQLPDREHCAGWTAVGYYFGEMLAKKLGVTVGLVECNYGGTSASAWISRDMLESTETGKAYLKDYELQMAGLSDEEADQAYLDYCEYHEKWQKKCAECYQNKPDISWEEVLKICGENRYPGPAAPINPLRPHGLYDTMITRIIPYTLRGVLYYQGESDDHRPEGYEILLSSLIRQWRKDFRDENLPFLLVQLPMHGYEDTKNLTNWSIIRQAQENIYRNTKNTGLAVILDCGEFNEIHPKEKRIPAERLYLQALKEVYHLQKDDTTAPLFRYAYPEGQGILVEFDNAESGLELRKQACFTLRDENFIWHPAQAEIQGDDILVRSPDVPEPTSLRYKSYDYGEVTLFEKDSVPVTPFFGDMSVKGDTVHIRLHEDNIRIRIQPTGFELRDDSGKWHPAQAEIRKNAVFVKNSEISHPTGVRYAWYNYGDVFLFGKNGLPASPFEENII